MVKIFTDALLCICQFVPVDAKFPNHSAAAGEDLVIGGDLAHHVVAEPVHVQQLRGSQGLGAVIL